jgi:c(7)-type cytochrome triheme protein
MRSRIIVISLSLIAALAATGWAADAKVRHDIPTGFSALFAAKTPKEIVFPSAKGDVTFNHTLHSKRVNNNCKTCHDKLFPESSAPINYKAAEHKTAETAKTSCGGCHYPGGDAFEAKGNCAKCHTRS